MRVVAVAKNELSRAFAGERLRGGARLDETSFDTPRPADTASSFFNCLPAGSVPGLFVTAPVYLWTALADAKIPIPTDHTFPIYGVYGINRELMMIWLEHNLLPDCAKTPCIFDDRMDALEQADLMNAYSWLAYQRAIMECRLKNVTAWRRDDSAIVTSF